MALLTRISDKVGVLGSRYTSGRVTVSVQKEFFVVYTLGIRQVHPRGAYVLLADPKYGLHFWTP